MKPNRYLPVRARDFAGAAKRSQAQAALRFRRFLGNGKSPANRAGRSRKKVISERYRARG